MKALVYYVNPVGWITCKWLRYFWPGCLVSPLNGLRLEERPVPSLPGPDWVRVRTRLGGICGTDVAILDQKQRPDSILQAFSSMPMGLGHENLAVVEEVGEAVDRSWIGRRVCVEPTLSCEPRGISPVCDRCRAGQFGACQNFSGAAAGSAGIPPGTSIGYNSRTGGSLGEYFVAHRSQLVAVPDEIDDELALLTDPLACSLHAVLRADLADVSRAMVYGPGVLGLGVVAALRAVGYTGRIDVVGRSSFAGDLARGLGADDLLRLPARPGERFEAIAARTGGTVQRARLGNYMLSGGYDVVFDCLGTRQALSESLKWTRSRGQVVLVGTGHGGGVDLTPIWFTELTVKGAYGRQIEQYQGRAIGTYQLVHELMARGQLNVRAMLTHTLPIERYREAMEISLNKSAHKAIKVALDFRPAV